MTITVRQRHHVRPVDNTRLGRVIIDRVLPADFEIVTDRLLLRPWTPSDADDFADMNADSEVMADLGGPLSREQSDLKLERFRRSFRDHGLTRWVVADRTGRFRGYCGIVRQGEDHPLGEHYEIGWRLIRQSWGWGDATEAASAALSDAFGRVGCPEVLAYTAADNARSQAVMARLGLDRRTGLDFTQEYDGFGPWRGLVWSAARPDVSVR